MRTSTDTERRREATRLRDAMIRASLMASPGSTANADRPVTRGFPRVYRAKWQFRGREKFEKKSPIATGAFSPRETAFLVARNVESSH